MDEAVTPHGLTTLMSAMMTTAMAAVLACGAHAAHAGPLADPTRPPASLAKALSGPAAPAAPVGPVLQSVLMSRQPGGRQIAVIDGETVRLGGTFRGAVLVRMTNTEVELQRGASRQVLKLFAAPAAKSTK